jgi:hypothetical protein
VSHIEDDAMTFRDRPLIKGFGTNQAEKLVASAAGVEDPFQKPPMNRDSIFHGKHSVSLTPKLHHSALTALTVRPSGLYFASQSEFLANAVELKEAASVWMTGHDAWSQRK